MRVPGSSSYRCAVEACQVCTRRMPNLMLTLSLQLIKQVDIQLVEELKDVENMYWPLS